MIGAEYSEQPEFRERFQRECETAASIQHPRVVPIYHAGEQDGRLYVTMRYVEGSDLYRLLQRGRLTPSHAAKLIGAGRRGPRCRAPARDRAPRRQAREHPHRHRRLGAADRLRADQARQRPRADPRRHVRRDARLRRAGAVPRRPGRRCAPTSTRSAACSTRRSAGASRTRARPTRRRCTRTSRRRRRRSTILVEDVRRGADRRRPAGDGQGPGATASRTRGRWPPRCATHDEPPRRDDADLAEPSRRASLTAIPLPPALTSEVGGGQFVGRLEPMARAARALRRRGRGHAPVRGHLRRAGDRQDAPGHRAGQGGARQGRDRALRSLRRRVARSLPAVHHRDPAPRRAPPAAELPVRALPGRERAGALHPRAAAARARARAGRRRDRVAALPAVRRGHPAAGVRRPRAPGGADPRRPPVGGRVDGPAALAHAPGPRAGEAAGGGDDARDGGGAQR